tara:strand:- start:176 stop:439 length:264 start_codon:yes stop_codon:yes gene_type:complete
MFAVADLLTNNTLFILVVLFSSWFIFKKEKPVVNNVEKEIVSDVINEVLDDVTSKTSQYKITKMRKLPSKRVKKVSSFETNLRGAFH